MAYRKLADQGMRLLTDETSMPFSNTEALMNKFKSWQSYRNFAYSASGAKLALSGRRKVRRFLRSSPTDLEIQD